MGFWQKFIYGRIGEKFCYRCLHKRHKGKCSARLWSRLLLARCRCGEPDDGPSR